MSGFLVDTNVLSEFSRRGDPNPNVRNWLNSVESESLYVSILTLAEIRRGIELLPPGKRREELGRWLEADLIASFPGANVLPVTKNIGDRWAVLSARAQERGVHLGAIDGLIAATALEHGLTLATRNIKDFVTLAVPLVNPWEST